MFIGEFSPTVFFKTCALAILTSLPIVYYLSQYYGHEKPFPNCWISKCAQHYPEFVFFRIATIPGALLMMLGWLTNHFYLKSICKEAAFRIEKYLPEIPLIVGLMGGMLLMGSTATIDTGVMKGAWHNFCASKFFTVTLIALVYNTFLYTVVHFNIDKVKTINLYFKWVLVALIGVQLYIARVYTGQEEEGEGFESVGIFLEWTMTLTILSNFYSLGVDVEGFEFVYEEKEGAERELMINEVD